MDITGELGFLVFTDAAVISEARGLFPLRELVPHASGSQGLVVT